MGARTRLLRWANGFALANAALLAVVGLRYLWSYSPLAPLVGWTFTGLAFVGHLSALAYIPVVLLVPVMLLIPWPRLVLPLAVFRAGLLLSFLVLDSMVFTENRYHLGVLTFSMLAPQTWAFLALYFLLGMAVEAMVAMGIWKGTARLPGRRIGWYVAQGLGGCLLASTLIHAWAGA
jgi:membrane-anchored protein YejM (alkaline phosphatase superfamily)